MKQITIALTIALTFSLCALFAAPAVQKPKWEYRIVDWPVMLKIGQEAGKQLSIEEALNIVGEKGWELVSVTRLADQNPSYYFKRQTE